MENKGLFSLICYLHRQLSRENHLLFAEYGISPVHYHALVFVNNSSIEGNKVCQRDIEKFFNLRPSSVSTLLTNLERNGFITRTVSNGDARTKFIELTEKGRSLCKRNNLLIEKCDVTIRSALTGDEQATLTELLTKIIETVNENKEVKS